MLDDLTTIKIPHAFSSEEAVAAAKKNQARFTPEERKQNSSRLNKIAQDKGTIYKFNEADRAAGGKARIDNLTKEQLQEIGRKGGLKGAITLNAMLTPEQRKANAKKAAASLTPEQRSARAKKAAETVRRNKLTNLT